MRVRLFLTGLLLITPLAAAGAASTTLILPDAPAKEGETVLINWRPAEPGTYRITAERVDDEGETVSHESATYVVSEKPKTQVATKTTGTSTVESSAQIQESIAKLSPQVANAATPVFATIDTWREKGAEALTRGEEWAKAKTTKGEIKGEQTESAEEPVASSGIAGTVMQMVATLLLYVFSLLKWLLGNAGVFYPVLAIVFFYILWRLYKRMRRPSYS